ncbi:MAG TPA: glycosyltransferase family 1 protein [Blastocatellia bacterium]|nr:glycosyltransferase family 1 protein [Blastocatellia bacterium]
MNAPRILAIIPRVPPVTDGIGDYGLALASALRRLSGIETEFVVGDPAWDGPAEVKGFAVRRVTSRSEREMLALLRRADGSDPSTLLLHYEGYGYANRGCPVWLVDALARWKNATARRRLVTIFHELYATGPLWTSSFWLSPLQRRLARRLVRLSDQRLTSLGLYAGIVQKLGNGIKAEALSLPVFSSIGEPAATSPLCERSRRLVVFGTRGRRIEVYRRSAAELNRICRQLGITEIIDIGRPIDFDIASVIDTPVVTCGELAGAEVSRWMLDSMAGVIDYPARFLGKSTIFAAYCAHGIIPIVASADAPLPAEGLEAGRHYWLTDESEALDIDSGQLIADNALAWYQAHNLSIHAENLAACLGGIGSPIR